MARAFLALTDDAELEVVQRSLVKALAAFAAVLVLALAAPVMWIAHPRPARRPSKAGDQPAATLATRRPSWPRPTTRTPTAEADGARAGSRDRGRAVDGGRVAAVGARRPSATDLGPGRGRRDRPGRTVLRRIGGGRRFEVFLVWDEHRLAVLVAKVLRPDQAEDTGALRDLVREGDLLARIAHPVVVRGFGTAAGGPFPHLLLEHLEGPTLQALLDQHGPVGLEQLLPLGMHVASALHYLAREAVVHLDVKPDNLVMGAPPRLIDFSVSRPRSAARLSKPVGTDQYMAPEQCDRTRGESGPRSTCSGSERRCTAR